MERNITLIGDVDEIMFSSINKRMNFLEEQSTAPIYVSVMSGGGDTHAAIGIYSRIKQSPNEVVVTAYGCVESAAVLILVAGSKRRISKFGWVMVHEDQVSPDTQSVSSIEGQVKHERALEDMWSYCLEQNTKADFATWTKLHKKTTWLYAKDCLRLGLVDEIIE